MKKLLICTFAAMAMFAVPKMAEARGGFGFHGGGFHGGGFHGGFHGGGFGFRRFGYGFGYGYPYYYGYPYDYGYYDGGYYADPYAYGGCAVELRRVHTRYGWRTRRIRICG